MASPLATQIIRQKVAEAEGNNCTQLEQHECIPIARKKPRDLFSLFSFFNYFVPVGFWLRSLNEEDFTRTIHFASVCSTVPSHET